MRAATRYRAPIRARIAYLSLIIAEDNTAYYCVENNESKIEKVLQELEKNGYTTALNQSSGIPTQRDAKLVLLLVQQ